ncbi:MAG: hypothetical protein WCL14_02335 [Bacteroidota bacterium]
MITGNLTFNVGYLHKLKVLSRQPAIKASPDSSGSPLLGVGNGQQRLQRIAGLAMIRDGTIGSKKELGITN